MEVKGKRIVLNPRTYPALTIPNGYLSPDLRAQACWTFYVYAQQMYEKVGKSVDDQFGIMEHELWMDTHYIQLAKFVAVWYGLESPAEFAKAWDQVQAQAKALNLPEPHGNYTRQVPRILGLN